MKKKIVFLPYDFDTAIGINNEGALVFSYNLEDIDTIDGGADVFNGQQSVFWKNMRATKFDEMKEMYQKLRSTGALSYADTERRFEEHQSKWPEAIFNEDAWFKYLAPLVESGNASYLSMLQGSKEEQRKWWLYNRYRYMDSKYNAGDALTDVITVRGYAKSDITVTPYADVYASVKYGSYLTQERAARNTEHTLHCPLDNVNDTEIYIYSASQLASVGDLSGLMVGYGDFSKATKLQNLKLGDASPSYSNGNLTELHLGNNVLLKTLDVRNCPNLKQAVDVSGCINIEEIYFNGTSITGLLLPNGGILKKLYLPATVTNLTIRNQTAITEFSIPSYVNISTLRLENVSSKVDSKAILRVIPENSRVRIIGFNWEVANATEAFALMDILDKMRGLDENGNNMEAAQVSGTMHMSSITGADMATMNSRYPNITITYDHIQSYCYYYNYDGSQLLYTASCLDGADASYSGTPSRSATAANTFNFVGWSTKPNQITADANATKKITADRKVYAAYSVTGRTYTVYFYNGSTLLATVPNVAYGSSAAYTGVTPVSADGSADDYPFEGWIPAPTNIQGNTSCYAVFGSPLEVKEITDSWTQILAAINNGSYKTKYKIGNYKPLDLGSEGVVNMQIAAKDAEPLADGSGNAPLSFVSMELLKTERRMNPSYVGKQAAVVYDPSATYLWNKVSGTENSYESSNSGKGGTSCVGCWVINPAASGTLTVTYVNSGEARYDYLTVWANDSEVFNGKSKGSQDYTGTYTIPMTAGTPIVIGANFLKDGGGNSGNDKGTITFTSDATFNVTIPNTTAIIKDVIPAKEGTGTIGGWEKTELRSYYKNTFKPLIPSEVRSAIKAVTKYTRIYDTNEAIVNNVETVEDVWIPSVYEMFGSYETKGTRYKALFPDNASHIKKKAGASSASWWWLRSAYSNSYFFSVSSGGGYTNGNAGTSGALALGFCL